MWATLPPPPKQPQSIWSPRAAAVAMATPNNATTATAMAPTSRVATPTSNSVAKAISNAGNAYATG